MTCVHLWGKFSRILERRRKKAQTSRSASTQTRLACGTWKVHFSLFVTQFLWGKNNCRLLKTPKTFLRPQAEETQQPFHNNNSDDLLPSTKLRAKRKVVHSTGLKWRLGNIFYPSMKTCTWLMSSPVCFEQNALINIWICALGAAQCLRTAPQLRYSLPTKCAYGPSNVLLTTCL